MNKHDEQLIWEAYVNEAVDPQLIDKIVNAVGADVIEANKGSYDALKGVIEPKVGPQSSDVIIAVMMRVDASVDEAYKLGEDDLSHGQYKGPQDLEPLARMEPRELGDEEEELESFEEGDDVEIHPRVGGGKGSVVEMSPSGTHGIIELSEDMEDGLSQGDRVAVHISDMSHIDGEEEPVDVDDLDPEDDVPYKEDNDDKTPVRIATNMPNPHGEGKPDEQEEWNARQHGHKNDPMYQTNEEGCGCGGPEVHDHGKPKVRGMGVEVSDDDMTDDKKPVIKVVKLKKKPALPGKIMRAITSALGLESKTVSEEYDADFERDEAHSTAGLSSFSSTQEADGWSPAETIDWHSDEVVQAAANFLDQDLLHPKVNSLDDVHQDLLDDLAGMVIHDMQKSGSLPNHLDYNEYLDERDEYKEAIESHLQTKFEELRDLAEDKAVARGDRRPADD